MRRVLPALLVVLTAVAACTGGEKTKRGDCSGPPPPIGGGFGAAPAPTAEVVLRTTSGAIVVATNGAPAAITFAPQGGFILLAGVRAAGFDECVDITAAIRDPQNANAIVSLEQRPAQLEDGGDGWLYPDQPLELYNWANLFVCETMSRDFDGGTWTLEIMADDGASVSTATASFVGRCAYDDLYCIDTCTVSTAALFAR